MTRAKRAKRGRSPKAAEARARRGPQTGARPRHRFSRQIVRRHAHRMLTNASRMMQPNRGVGMQKPRQQREETMRATKQFPKGRVERSPYTKPALSQRRDTRRKANRAARRARRHNR